MAGHHQPTTDPRLYWRLLETLGKVWVSALWGHCSFLLGPGAHKVLFVPSKSLFPQSCGSSVIKSHWPSKSNSLGFLSPFAGSSGWEICHGFQNFCKRARTSLGQLFFSLWVVYSVALWWGSHVTPPRSAAARAPVPAAGNC